MHQSATRYVVLYANVGSSKGPWVSRHLWSTGTLANKVGEMYEDLRDSYRKDHGLDKTEDVEVYLTGLSVFDNELPKQYEQPPMPQQPAEPTLESLVASTQRLAEISTKGNIDLSPAINAIQDKIVALMAAGTMR